MPLYESDNDAQNEYDVARRIECAFGFTMHKLEDKRSPFDWIATRLGSVRGVVEIKCRTNKMDKYPTYMIAKHKVDTLVKLSAYLHVKSMIAVRFVDGIRWFDPLKDMDGSLLSVGGRKDRGDANDIEMVYQIPISNLRALPIGRDVDIEFAPDLEKVAS